MTFRSYKYRVGHSGAGTSQTGATSGPTHLDLRNLRASMSKAYEDAKGDVADVKALIQLNEQFSQPVSLRRASRAVSFQHASHVASTGFVTQASFRQFNPSLTICDPVGLVKTKGCPKVATWVRSGMKRAPRTEKRGRVVLWAARAYFHGVW